MCFVVTCWERADLLALVCGVFCEFVTFPLVSWVRCGTWLYRFLIFATLLLLFWSVQTFEFQYFFGFPKNVYLLGMKIFVIFLGNCKTGGPFWGYILCILWSFLTYNIGIFLGGCENFKYYYAWYSWFFFCKQWMLDSSLRSTPTLGVNSPYPNVKSKCWHCDYHAAFRD